MLKGEFMRRDYIAVIQAGGKGTRMVDLTKDKIPKPMLLLGGKPMLQWQIEDIAKYGIRDFVIILGYLGDKVKAYFGDGSKIGVNISYIEETSPLGSAGALYYLKEKLKTDNFLLVFGDVMFEIDWERMISFHEANKGKVTLLAHPNAHPYDSDLLIIDEQNIVVGIDSKNNVRDYWYDNCVNAGIYILSKEVLEQINEPIKTDLEKDILALLIKSRDVYGYVTPEYVKDAGTPERFAKIYDEKKRGLWSAKCLNKKQKCIFLDRDGTINRFNGLISNEVDFELESVTCEAVKRINESGYLAIVVTNQPVVARGLCEVEDVKRIHQKMQVLVGKEEAFFDDIIFCPHHPDKGYPEENPKYKIKCNCRKPAIGMIEDMVKKYNIDLSQSYFIGDSTIDIQTGINAGIKTVLVKTGQAGNDRKYDVKADFEATDLLEAINIILGNTD